MIKAVVGRPIGLSGIGVIVLGIGVVFIVFSFVEMYGIPRADSLIAGIFAVLVGIGLIIFGVVRRGERAVPSSPPLTPSLI